MLLYRAYDEMYISRLGLAESRDGVHFRRDDLPAIDTDPDDPYERIGIEDPRITKFGDTYYIVHTSASVHALGHRADVGGVRSYIPWRVRVGMHTTKDFRTFRRYGVILPDVPAKNASLLPEKQYGAFGLYYREGRFLKLSWTKDFRRWHKTRILRWPTAEKWQSFKFGTGSQAIAVREGFLMVYHAVDARQVYRLGLMLFDRKNPAQILWHLGPILQPETSYEKKGYIPNVVYTCGAIIRRDELWIYYGAADRVTARAVLPLRAIPHPVTPLSA
jgi:beta-1,2-mannobiose phosphorylase / 1,2-beta-oligomannan phosphorylase